MTMPLKKTKAHQRASSPVVQAGYRFDRGAARGAYLIAIPNGKGYMVTLYPDDEDGDARGSRTCQIARNNPSLTCRHEAARCLLARAIPPLDNGEEAWASAPAMDYSDIIILK